MPATATRPAVDQLLRAFGCAAWPEQDLDPGRHRIVLGTCAIGHTGAPFMSITDGFYGDYESALAAMDSRARDTQDPNPLASFYIDLGERRPTVKLLEYSPVAGASTVETHVPLAGLTVESLYEAHRDYGAGED